MGDEETASSRDCPHCCESLTVKGKNEFRVLHRRECKVLFLKREGLERAYIQRW